jgi:hypothetical protein
MANLNDTGIQSISTALVESFSVERVLKESSPVLTSSGGFHDAEAYDPTHPFTISGKGDCPADFTIGSDGNSLAIAGVTGGKTIISNVKKSQRNTEHVSWEVSGENFPGAS